jgi:hypothetical protein
MFGISQPPLRLIDSAGKFGASIMQSSSREEAEANAALIVSAVNFHDQLIAALKAISTHWANQDDHPNMEAPKYRGPYVTGVTDGHRACKAIADKALALLDGQGRRTSSKRPTTDVSNLIGSTILAPKDG